MFSVLVCWFVVGVSVSWCLWFGGEWFSLLVLFLVLLVLVYVLPMACVGELVGVGSLSGSAVDLPRGWGVERVTYNDVDDLLLTSYQYISRPIMGEDIVWYNVEYEYSTSFVPPVRINYYYSGYTVSFRSRQFNSSSIDYTLGGKTLLHAIPEKKDTRETIFYRGIGSTIRSTQLTIPLTIPQLTPLTSETKVFPEWFKPTDIEEYRVIDIGSVDEDFDGESDGEEVYLYTWYPGSTPSYRRLTYSVKQGYYGHWDSMYESNPQIDDGEIAWASWSEEKCGLYINGEEVGYPAKNCNYIELLFFQTVKQYTMVINTYTYIIMGNT